MRGRITEKQLPLAEESFPGICGFYRDLVVKPATFLQLVWLYEGWLERGRPGDRRRGATT